MNQLFRFSMALFAVVAFTAGAFGDSPSGEAKPERMTKEERLEQKRLSRISKTTTPVEGFESVEMFSAMESGEVEVIIKTKSSACLLYTSPSPRDATLSRMPSSA